MKQTLSAAGEYAGQVTLTVTPQINEAGGACSLAVTTYPFIDSGVGDEGGDACATMAVEDLYPNPGDADYNDMVEQIGHPQLKVDNILI